jgi:succinyl-CoA synthetase beta subunit
MKKLMLSESEGYDLLREYGVPVPAFRIVMTPHEAAEAAETIFRWS